MHLFTCIHVVKSNMNNAECVYPSLLFRLPSSLSFSGSMHVSSVYIETDISTDNPAINNYHYTVLLINVILSHSCSQ